MSVYDIITEQITDQLEKGVVPWKQTWKCGVPMNFITKKPYNGFNSMFLAFQGYTSPYWITFNQCSKRGGKIKKGEKSTIVVFWNPTTRTVEEKGKTKEKPSLLLRYYRVWNIEQCEGIEMKDEDREVKPIKKCEDVVKGYKDIPEIKHGMKPCYMPKSDQIGMPKQKAFDKDEYYYSTLFHEMAHSTGHEKRLDRKEGMLNARYGSENYSKEELIAELGACFLCGHTGVAPMTMQNSASYIANWLTALKNDKKLLISASSKAQKAVNYILSI